MLIQATTIVGLPIAAVDTQSKIAEVKKIVINPENGEILGFLVSTPGIFSKHKVFSSKDILDFDRNGIVTKSEENLVETDEIARIKKILDSNIVLIGQNALTKSKKKLGKVNDLLIDTEALLIIKYYIHGLFQDKILPSEKVVKIDHDGVIFSDDVIEQTPSGEVEGAAA